MKLDFMKILRVSLMKAGGDRGDPKSILTESSAVPLPTVHTGDIIWIQACAITHKISLSRSVSRD